MENKKKYYKDYSKYLKGISFKAKIYRKFFYFPKLYKLMKGKKLEIGCGIGSFLENYNDVLGIDINQDLIEFCNKMNLNAFVMEEDIIPYPDKSFDSILMDNVLEHIKDPLPLLMEVKRVSSNESNVIVSVPGIKGFTWDKDHKTFYDEKSLTMLFEKIGFQTTKIFYTPLKNKFLNQNMRQYCLHAVFNKK